MKTSREHIESLIDKMTEDEKDKGRYINKRYSQEIYDIAQLMDVFMTPSQGEYITVSEFEDRMNEIRKKPWRFNMSKDSETIRMLSGDYFERYHPEHLWWGYLFSALSLYKPKG